MKKKLAYRTSFRVTFGDTKQHIGWINTDETIDLSKQVKGVSADNSDAVEDLLTGVIDSIDTLTPIKKFHLVAKTTGDKTPDFLGYFETTKPANADTLLALWPHMHFSQVIKAI